MLYGISKEKFGKMLSLAIFAVNCFKFSIYVGILYMYLSAMGWVLQW